MNRRDFFQAAIGLGAMVAFPAEATVAPAATGSGGYVYTLDQLRGVSHMRRFSFANARILVNGVEIKPFTMDDDFALIYEPALP